MRNVCIFLILAGTLAGCAWGTPQPAGGAAAGFSDPACTAVARTRADDAAINGYEADLVDRVARDSYSACMASKPNIVSDKR